MEEKVQMAEQLKDKKTINKGKQLKNLFTPTEVNVCSAAVEKQTFQRKILLMQSFVLHNVLCVMFINK